MILVSAAQQYVLLCVSPAAWALILHDHMRVISTRHDSVFVVSGVEMWTCVDYH